MRSNRQVLAFLSGAILLLPILAERSGAVRKDEAALFKLPTALGGGVRRAIAEEEMNAQDRRMLALAKAASSECAGALERAMKQGVKSEEELFSTLYFPILPLTTPPTYTTFYDDYTDKALTPIEDRYLGKDPNVLFVILVDVNGYVPSHNSRYSKPATGDPQADLKNRRTKRIFNDITGFFSAKHAKGPLLQLYRRDTGEIIADLSVPVFVKGRRWGALRIGYARGA
jgi:methyl-accepting chemotaxis protein